MHINSEKRSSCLTLQVNRTWTDDLDDAEQNNLPQFDQDILPVFLSCRCPNTHTEKRSSSHFNEQSQMTKTTHTGLRGTSKCFILSQQETFRAQNEYCADVALHQNAIHAQTAFGRTNKATKRLQIFQANNRSQSLSASRTRVLTDQTIGTRHRRAMYGFTHDGSCEIIQ